ATAVHLRRRGRGVIHIHSPHTYAALRHCFRLAAVLRVLHIHLDFPVESLRWTLREPPELIITCARFLIDRVRQALPSHLQERQWIEALPNAIDVTKFMPGDKREAKRLV